MPSSYNHACSTLPASATTKIHSPSNSTNHIFNSMNCTPKILRSALNSLDLGDFGHSLRVPADRQQFFDEEGRFKPGLLVAYFPIGRQRCLSCLSNWFEDNAQEDERFSSGTHCTPRCQSTQHTMAALSAHRLRMTVCVAQDKAPVNLPPAQRGSVHIMRSYLSSTHRLPQEAHEHQQK